MPNLERIVRPFATRDTTPPRAVKSSEDKPAETGNLRLELGRDAPAGGQVLISTYSSSTTGYMTHVETEQDGKRKTHEKTITSDDGKSSIDVEVIDELLVKRGKGPDFQGTKYKYKNEASE